MTIQEKYIKIIKNTKDKNNNIKVRVYYDLGGWNIATAREKLLIDYICNENGYILEG